MGSLTGEVKNGKKAPRSYVQNGIFNCFNLCRMDIIQNSYSEWLRILERPFHDEVRHLTVLATLESSCASCAFESRVLQFVRIRLSKIDRIFNGFRWFQQLDLIQTRLCWIRSRRDLAKDLALRMELVQLMTPQQVRCSRSTVLSTGSSWKQLEAKTMSPYVTVCHRMSPRTVPKMLH